VDKRKQRRTRKRLTCELVIGESRQTVLVRDLSPEGLFVQTRAKVDPNGRIRLVFAAKEDLPAIEVEARVARKRITPPRLQSSVPSGVGLEVIDPSDDYYALVERSVAKELRSVDRVGRNYSVDVDSLSCIEGSALSFARDGLLDVYEGARIASVDGCIVPCSEVPPLDLEIQLRPQSL
jgi:hypothetical protein